MAGFLTSDNRPSTRDRWSSALGAGASVYGMTENPYAALAAGLASGATAQASDPKQQYIPVNRGAFSMDSALGTTAYDPATAQFTTALSDPYKKLQESMLASSQGFMGGLGTYDPQAVTQRQYEQLEAMQTPARERERLALEDRLYAQGRLGSTGGALQQQAQQEAFQQQQAMNQQLAFQQGLTGQRQLADLATGLMGQSLLPQQNILKQLEVTGAFAPQYAGDPRAVGSQNPYAMGNALSQAAAQAEASGDMATANTLRSVGSYDPSTQSYEDYTQSVYDATSQAMEQVDPRGRSKLADFLGVLGIGVPLGGLFERSEEQAMKNWENLDAFTGVGGLYNVGDEGYQAALARYNSPEARASRGDYDVGTAFGGYTGVSGMDADLLGASWDSWGGDDFGFDGGGNFGSGANSGDGMP